MVSHSTFSLDLAHGGNCPPRFKEETQLAVGKVGSTQPSILLSLFIHVHVLLLCRGRVYLGHTFQG